MNDIESMQTRILIGLNYHGNRDEFLRGDFYLAPSELAAWDSAEKYDMFWEAVYALKNRGFVHIRYEANANMLALTENGFEAVKQIRSIVTGRP